MFVLFLAVKATKELQWKKENTGRITTETKGNVAKRILNQRAINATVVGKAAQHLGTNVNRARTNHFASVCKSSRKRAIKRYTVTG